jgi:hypothetical protein
MLRRVALVRTNFSEELSTSFISGMLHHVDLVRTNVSEQLSASFIMVARIDELGTTLAVNSNWHAAKKQ